ncbi:MAG: hypothetical protein HY658_12475, partial [Actinobacteria bacterium]|nr:hypothetical protein [Actinomycetota bacterium]
RLLELAEQLLPEGFEAAGVAHHRVPGVLSLVLGDALHNYRSALDHLVFQLALMGRDGGDAPEGTQFVIRDTPEAFEKAKARGYLDGVAQQHQDMIESVQPYRSADPALHPLGLLRDLSNVDKHRIIHLFEVAPGFSTPDGDVGPYLAISGGLPIIQALERIDAMVAAILDRFEEKLRRLPPPVESAES